MTCLPAKFIAPTLGRTLVTSIGTTSNMLSGRRVSCRAEIGQLQMPDRSSGLLQSGRRTASPVPRGLAGSSGLDSLSPDSWQVGFE